MAARSRRSTRLRRTTCGGATILPDWPSTAEAAWIELASLFPQQPCHCIEVDETCHHGLDEALEIAHAHLAEWDPGIDFCGGPDAGKLLAIAVGVSRPMTADALVHALLGTIAGTGHPQGEIACTLLVDETSFWPRCA